MASSGATGPGAGPQELLLQMLQQQQQMMGQQQAQLNVLTRLVEKQSSGQTRGVVDLKAVGRPEPLGGTLEEACSAWRHWSYKYELWLASQWDNAAQVLRWCESETATIDQTVLQSKSAETGFDTLLQLNRQLEVTLASLTKEVPGDVVYNSHRGSGCDAWRRLSARLNPNNPLSNLRLLRKIMSPMQCTDISDLHSSLEKWEALRCDYAKRPGCSDLSDEQARVVLLAMAPDSLREYLDLNLGRLNSYALLRSEVLAYAEQKRQREVDSHGAQPMEVDALTKGGGKARRTATKQDLCHHCGKPGHFKRDCRLLRAEQKHKPQPSKGQSKGKGRGRGGKTGQKGSAAELEAEVEDVEPEEEQYDEEPADIGFLSVVADSNELSGSGLLQSEPSSSSRLPAQELASVDYVETFPQTSKVYSKVSASSAPTGLRLVANTLKSKLHSTVTVLDKEIASAESHGAEAEVKSLRAEKALVEAQSQEVKEQVQRVERARSRRFQADIEAGHSPRLAWRKEKSRLRAAQHRQDTRADRAAERICLEKEWADRHRVPGSAARKEKEYPIIPHLQDEVAAPLAWKELRDCRQENEEEWLEPVRHRSWKKPEKQKKTQQQRQAKRLREERRLKKKRAHEQGGSQTASGSGSARPEPMVPKPPPGPPPKYVRKHGSGSVRPEPNDSGRLLALESAKQEAKQPSLSWQKLVVTLDSGASDNVVPAGLFKQCTLGPVKGFREFATATGFKIPNLGSIALDMYLGDWRKFSSMWSVADVKRPLLSMTKVLKHGHKVVMDSKSSYIQLSNSHRIDLDLSSGVPTFTVWVLMPFRGLPNAKA